MNIDRYRKDIAQLVDTSEILLISMAHELGIEIKPKPDQEKLKKLPKFSSMYQSWYSEALACVRQLLPDRLDDFISFYKPIRVRKEITYANYTISDYLQGLSITRGPAKEKIVGPDAAVPAFQQQMHIVEALRRRFETALFDIRALVQADFFDDELDVADELNRKGFSRAAGAVAGVALEGHLLTICDQHNLTRQKNPSIGELNDLLKKSDVVDVPTWRFIQHLGDIRKGLPRALLNLAKRALP
jgi:hypothetical protein